jgi:hypothetical protein
MPQSKKIPEHCAYASARRQETRLYGIAMASYRISEDAKADLREFYRHGVREYDAAANNYYDTIFSRIERLSIQPYSTSPVDRVTFILINSSESFETFLISPILLRLTVPGRSGKHCHRPVLVLSPDKRRRPGCQSMHWSYSPATRVSGTAVGHRIIWFDSDEYPSRASW